MHGPGLGAGPGLPAWLQLLGRRRGRRRPGARRSNGLRLGGRGCGLSPTAEIQAPGPGPGQQLWQQWQYQQQPRPPPLPCQASPARALRRDWARRGPGPAEERCLCGSGWVRSGGCARRGLSLKTQATSVAPGRAVGLFGVRGLFLPKWESIWALLTGRKGFFLPPQRRLAGGGEGKGGQGRGGREERMALAGGARVRRALGLRGSPSANPSGRCFSRGGRVTASA